MNYTGLILVGGGLLAIAGALFDWDFFMNSRKAQWIVGLLGRAGARVFYCVLGGVILVIGLLTQFGIMELSSHRP